MIKSKLQMVIYYNEKADTLHKHITENDERVACHPDCKYVATLGTSDYLKKEKALDDYYLKIAKQRYGKSI